MLGPSGSGKTTTLRMIAGFEQPTSGRVVLHGRDVTGVPPFERDVNTVFQDYALFPHMTVGDNVGYGLMVRKVDKATRRERVAEALRMVRLPGLRAAQAERAVGRPAAADRARSRARQPPAGAAPRRAARRARPEAPRGHADRAQADPATGRHHVHLRHPRPGRGAHDERPPGGLQQRPDRAARSAGRGLRAAHDPLRRRLRRDLESDHRRCGPAGARQGRVVHDPSREDPPGRARHRGRGGRAFGRRPDPGRRRTSARTRATGSRSMPARSSSSPNRTSRRPRPRRSPRKARLSASSGSDSTSSPSQTGARWRRTTRHEESEASGARRDRGARHGRV